MRTVHCTYKVQYTQYRYSNTVTTLRTDHRIHSITMATPVKSDNPAVLCTSTKEDLLKGDVLKVWDNCPICCDDYGILCRVARHPSTVLMLTTDDVVTVLITVHCTLYIQY